jgi:hypothetical protein
MVRENYEIFEIELNEERIDELKGKLDELKKSHEHFHFEGEE